MAEIKTIHRKGEEPIVLDLENFAHIEYEIIEIEKAELPSGALVLSNTFALPGWRAIEERTVPDIHRSKVYLYRKGE